MKVVMTRRLPSHPLLGQQDWLIIPPEPPRGIAAVDSLPTMMIAPRLPASVLQLERELLLNRVRALDQGLQTWSSRRLLTMRNSRVLALPPLVSATSSSAVAVSPSAASGFHLPVPRTRPSSSNQEEHPIQERTAESDSTDTSKNWEVMFKRLVRYRLRHGNNSLLKIKNDPKLGTWVKNQRKRKKEGRLSQERIDLLEAIGFVWQTVQIDKWETMFDRLVKYKEEHGDCLCPRTYKKDRKLGRWVDTQRNRSDLSQERIQKLEDIGFVWQVQQKCWDSMYARLVNFRERFGHCLVPCVYEDDPKLGTWVHVQRSRRTLMSEERKARLNEIDFCWSVLEPKGGKD